MYKYILCLLFFITNLSIQGQPYCDVRTFNIRDGLAANIISGMGQTPDDLMWFSTWNGLCYFDGYHFTTFRDHSGESELLSSNRFLSVCPNSYGDVWCITYDRNLYVFNTHQCQYKDLTKRIYDQFHVHFSSRSVYSLSDGYTWIAADGKEKQCIRIHDCNMEAKGGIEFFKGFCLKKVLLGADSTEWLFTDKGIRSADGKIHCSLKAEYMVSTGSCTYFAAPDGKMACYMKGAENLKKMSPRFDIHKINCMVVYGKGKILLGTDQGLLIYNASTRRYQLRPVVHPMSASSEVKEIFVDSRSRIWLFTGGDGVMMIDNKKGVTEWLQSKARNPLEITTSKDFFIHEDEHHTIWLVPSGGTFSYYDENSHCLQPFVLHTEGSLYADLPLINKYYIDKQNNLWFTGDRDLSVVNFKYHHIKIIPTFPNQEVRAITADRKGNIWVGDHEGMLTIWDTRGKLKGYVSPEGTLQSSKIKFTTRIYALYEDKKGRMWIGTKEDGLYCISRNKVRHFLNDPKDKWSISFNDIYDFDEDTQGRLWIASYEKGLNLLSERKDGTMRFINGNNILKNYPGKLFNKIRRITHTSQGVIVLSTNSGIVTFSDKFSNFQNIHFYTTCHQPDDLTSLTTSDVMQTLVTRKGRIYVATMGGDLQLMKSTQLLQDNLKLTRVKEVSPDEGLVQSMVEDRRGIIWLIRETTMDEYNPETGQIQQFGSNDLDYREEFSEAKPCLDPCSGELLMACNGAFLVFNPLHLKKSTYSPKIVFTGVQYQGERDIHTILNMEELEVPSHKRNLTIFFAALDYTGNDFIRYAYMLDGVDAKWNYVGSAHSASFNDLPHGHLKLLVRSTNADGVWQNNERILNIYVHPTFWESWMGWLFYFLLGGGIIFVAMYIFVQQQRLNMQSEMNELRTSFFTNIGHKLRTPLTLIGGPVTEVLNKENLSEKGRELMEMVQRNSRSMLDLVNNMLNYENKHDNFFVDDVNAPIFIQTENLQTFFPSNGPAHPDVKLLVVEDNDDLRSFLYTILSSDYNVIIAENGKDGLNKATAELPDFIITDVMMPVMDGLAMIHEIKANKNTSHIPTVILSAKASLADRLQGLKEGVDDYITKPFSATYLKQRVENIISQRKALQQQVLEQLQLNGEKFKQKEMLATEKPEYKLHSPDIVDEDKEMMDKLMAYLEKHIGDTNLKIDDLAEAIHLGRTVFYGKMKSIVGMTPVDFLRHVRLQRAEELVVKSNMTFSEIAYVVGFSDPKYFTKCFKKKIGMTPSEYRAKAH